MGILFRVSVASASSDVMARPLVHEPCGYRRTLGSSQSCRRRGYVINAHGSSVRTTDIILNLDGACLPRYCSSAAHGWRSGCLGAMAEPDGRGMPRSGIRGRSRATSRRTSTGDRPELAGGQLRRACIEGRAGVAQPRPNSEVSPRRSKSDRICPRARILTRVAATGAV